MEEHSIQNIEVNDIEIGEVVGYGGFGKIYKSTYNKSEVRSIGGGGGVRGLRLTLVSI